MKKFLLTLVLPLIMFVSGCGGNLMNTPTKQAENFFSRYQTLDIVVLDQLDKIVANETQFNTEQRERYKKIMKKHYQGITYHVKEEIIDGDIATVTMEIEVTDYSKILRDAAIYLNEHQEEFQDENGIFSEEKYMDYRLDQMEEANKNKTYTLEMIVSKIDDKWTLNDLNENDRDKIHGVYVY